MRKLNSRELSILKLAIWSAFITWMAFFIAMGLLATQILASLGPEDFGGGSWANILAFIAPIWSIFTILLTVVILSRYVSRKLGGMKNDSSK